MNRYLFLALLVWGTLNADEELQMNATCEGFVIGEQLIYTVSPFEDVTYFTAYSFFGECVWEIPFGLEILSWKIHEGQILIFSHAFNNTLYLLTCVDAVKGSILWERPILSPKNFSSYNKVVDTPPSVDLPPSQESVDTPPALKSRPELIFHPVIMGEGTKTE